MKTTRQRILHPRHRVDASVSDALYALTAGLRPNRSDTHLDESTLVCLSVRTAFDALLRTLAFTPGDEILVSAITHPDMIRIIKLHGLRAVPIDIDPNTLGPIRPLMDGLLTHRTRMILVAHLFGTRLDLDGFVTFARDQGLLLVEDCAQSLESGNDQGDARCDVSLFSFGFIKTSTALGGALARIRDDDLRLRMRSLVRSYPQQSRMEYASKAIKCLIVVLFQRPRIYPLAKHVIADPGALVRTRAIEDDLAYIRWLKRRPSAGLIAMLDRRIRHFSLDRLQARERAGGDMAAALPSWLTHPGMMAGRNTHWVFPVSSSEPSLLVDHLRSEGFEATTTTSQICALPNSPAAQDLMTQIVFVPVYPEMSESERGRLRSVLNNSQACS